MEPDKLIQAFTQVVREQDYVFSPEAITAIPELQKNLAELETQTPDLVAEVLRLWYIEYEDVRDAVLIEEREITRVRKTQPENQENIQENRYRVLEEDLAKLHNNKTATNQPNKP